MKNLWGVLTLILIAACSSPTVKDTNDLTTGMDKNKVEKIFGEPKSTRGNEEETYLTYDLKDGMWSEKEEYIFVFDSTSKLKSYGKKGDFDSLEVEQGRVIQKQESED